MLLKEIEMKQKMDNEISNKWDSFMTDLKTKQAKEENEQMIKKMTQPTDL